MQTTIAAIGPYRFKVTKTEKGISNVEIFKEPKGKTKKLDKFSILNTKIVQLETLIGSLLDVAGTVFQKKVWTATAKIPYGETRTYADIAKTIGHPKAVRAVGTALGRTRRASWYLAIGSSRASGVLGIMPMEGNEKVAPGS